MDGVPFQPTDGLVEDADVMEAHVGSIATLDSTAVSHPVAPENYFVGNVGFGGMQLSEQYRLGNPQQAGAYTTTWLGGSMNDFGHINSLPLSSAVGRDDTVMSSLSSSSNSDFASGFYGQNRSLDWTHPASSLQDAYSRLEIIWKLLPYADDVQITAVSVITGLSRERTRAFYMTAPFLALKQPPMRELAVDLGHSVSAPNTNSASESSFARPHYSGHPDPVSSRFTPSSSHSQPRVANQSLRKVRQAEKRNLECFWPRCAARLKKKKFKNEGELRRHMEPLHCPQFVWTCPTCAQQFKRRDKLIKHVKELAQTHLTVPVNKASLLNYRSPQDPPSRFRDECGFCGAVILIWNDLVNHVVNHFDKGKTMAEWRDPWIEEGGSDSGPDQDDDDDDEDEDEHDDDILANGREHDGGRGDRAHEDQTNDKPAKDGRSETDNTRPSRAEGTYHYKFATNDGSTRDLILEDLTSSSAHNFTRTDLRSFSALQDVKQEIRTCREADTMAGDLVSDDPGRLTGDFSLVKPQELPHHPATPFHTNDSSNQNGAASEEDSVADEHYVRLSKLSPQSSFSALSDASTLLAAPMTGIIQNHLGHFLQSRTSQSEQFPTSTFSDECISWESCSETVPEGRTDFLHFLCNTVQDILIQESARWFAVYLEQRIEEFWPLIRNNLAEVSEKNHLPTNKDMTAVYKVLIALWKELATKPNVTLLDMVDCLVNDRLLVHDVDYQEYNTLCKVVFTLLGCLTTLYEPRRVEDAKPGKLQITKNVREPSSQKALLETSVIAQKSQGFECVDQPLYSLLSVFGRLLPEPIKSERENYFRPTDLINASQVCIYSLQKVCGIQIQWVDTLSLHLDFDVDKKILRVYRLPSFCLLMYQGKKKHALLNRMYADQADLHNIELSDHNSLKHFFKEILLTYRLIFGQDQSSWKLFEREQVKLGSSSSIRLASQDPMLRTLCAQSWNTPKAREIYEYIQAHDIRQSYVSNSFPFFCKRLLTVQNYAQSHKPASLEALWFDRRDVSDWWAFWAVVFIGGSTISLMILSLVFQVWQILLAQEQLQQS